MLLQNNNNKIRIQQCNQNKKSNLVFSKKEVLHLFVHVNLREYKRVCKKEYRKDYSFTQAGLY